jgi:hypothetical protein
MGKTQNTGNLTNALAQDSSNNIGIGGAANASYKLQVTGATNLTGALTGTTSSFTTRVDIGTRSSGNIRNLNIYGATNGNAIIKLDGADGNGYGAQVDFISKTSGGTSNTWTLGTGVTGGANAFELFNGATTVLNFTQAGAATFSSSVTATAATFSDIVTNTTGGYRTLASQGYILRNDANSTNLGGLTRRSYWAGGAALDTQIFAETGYGIFLNVNGSSTTGINILSTGNVGIGTSSPSSISGYTILSINNTSGGLLDLKSNGTSVGQIYVNSGGLSIDANGANPTVFYTNSTERMRITSGGSILIGSSTDTGNGLLEIKAPSAKYGMRIYSPNTTNNCFGLWVDGGSSSADNALLIRNQSGSATYFLIRGDGYLQSPSTYNNTTASPNYLSISSSGFFERFVASSARYKEEIKDWDVNGLSIILALRPRTYRYKKEYYNKADVDFLGLIAEEVAEVNTYLADYENEDGTGQVENVRYATIVVPLIKAVQELEARIKQLENK